MAGNRGKNLLAMHSIISFIICYRFKENGGKLEVRTVNSLEEVKYNKVNM